MIDLGFTDIFIPRGERTVQLVSTQESFLSPVPRTTVEGSPL